MTAILGKKGGHLTLNMGLFAQIYLKLLLLSIVKNRAIKMYVSLFNEQGDHSSDLVIC